MSKPITAIIVGAGHRAMMYASYALQNPDAPRSSVWPIRFRDAACGPHSCLELTKI